MIENGTTGPSARSLLVLGGARSGKSAYAQAQAERSGLALTFCATAARHQDDSEMTERIARHRAARDGRWRTVEAPLGLADALAGEAAPGRIVLVDCLTLWLTNVVLDDRDAAHETALLADGLPALPGPVIFVSNEVGSGIVPDNALARLFRDAQGRLNQRMAQACDTVVLVAAGLPVLLKPQPAVEIGFEKPRAET